MFLYIFIYQYFKYWINIFYFFFYSFLFDIQKVVAPSVDSPEKILYNRELDRFVKYELREIANPCEKNQNIDAFFYDKTKYKQVFEDPKNEYEVIWKRRILYMTTPIGNIAMFYDPFKLGFSYYADQSYVKYDILNAMAMKYVILFRCLDFFMDEHISKIPSPLIKVHFIEDKKTDTSKPNYNAIQAAKTDKSPFAKFKKPSIDLPPILRNKLLPNTRTNEINEKEKAKEKEKNLNRNKFLYLGKIQNFNFIQPIPKNRRRIPIFQSTLLDGIEKNASIQSECLSYKDYIKMQKANKEE